MTTEHPERPGCAGWHESDPECDGSKDEPACEYRDRCLALIAVMGGKGKRTGELVDATVADWDEDRLDEWFGEQEEVLARLAKGAPSPKLPKPRGEPPEDSGGPRQEVPVESPLRRPTAPAALAAGSTPIPGFGEAVKKHRPDFDIHPRPSPRYDHVLPIVDAFVERFARELGRVVVLESDKEMKVGDIFLRFTPGMSGRLVAVYEATARKTYRHRLVGRIVLVTRNPQFNLKANTGDYSSALSLQPPSSTVCRYWKDTVPSVALVGVTAHSARDAATWLARVYNAELLGGRT